jgi:ABC-type glutathione transport system ATPase component
VSKEFTNIRPADERMIPPDIPLLEVSGLCAVYRSGDMPVPCLDNISFSLSAGESMGVIGGSGAGKSSLAYAVMGIMPFSGKITAGTVRFRGKVLPRPPQKYLWKEIAMIFQGAMNALNPVLKIAAQMEECLKIHSGLPKTARRKRMTELLETVGLDPLWADRYPHELSGGMKQRVLIALALSCNPSLLIADEPTTHLDVLRQKDIMDLFRHLREKLGLSLIFISHDPALLGSICEKLMVMHQGRIAEMGNFPDILRNPLHARTRELLHHHRKIADAYFQQFHCADFGVSPPECAAGARQTGKNRCAHLRPAGQ